MHWLLLKASAVVCTFSWQERQPTARSVSENNYGPCCHFAAAA